MPLCVTLSSIGHDRLEELAMDRRKEKARMHAKWSSNAAAEKYIVPSAGGERIVQAACVGALKV